MAPRTDELLPIEASILAAGLQLVVRGVDRFYGFQVSKEIKEASGAKLLTAYGTLYKALDRLQRRGYLASEWEDPAEAARDNRPRRRFYHVTSAGAAALERYEAARPSPSLAWQGAPS
ncbi:MAG TPA: PadR family transcriptional regulator [Chloroflexota bacterium]|nr:PadR family transcriptional regulator [Chloroflexota bacterium]